jgi:3-hydroxymyristoyl/3-hydroxydecanoyl-(acyl carrier protein) dehydratase
MAQVGGVLLMGTVEDPESTVVYFMSIEKIKFRKPVRPGDQLRFEVEVLQLRGSTCRIGGVAMVDGGVGCEAEMAAMVRDR